VVNIRTELCDNFSWAPTTQISGLGDYERIVAVMDDGTEKEIWRGDKWFKEDYDKRVTEEEKSNPFKSR
jgi:hypothetical protein